MCERCGLELIHKARLVADELTEALRLNVRKAMELSNPEGFDRAVATLAARLRSRAQPAEASAVRSAVAALDVDWGNTSSAQRRALLREARASVSRLTTQIPGQLQAVFKPTAREVVETTRSHARRQRLSVAADFNAVDQRITKFLSRTNSLFITDEYSRRLQGFETRALQVVSDGLEAGLGRDDIAASLAKAADGLVIGRNGFYWEVVAGAFIGSGRSFAQMSAYAEAGIRRYTIEAVLDERTTEICRYLHGKTFEVRDGLDRFDGLDQLKTPQELKDASPWVRSGPESLYVTRAGQRVPIPASPRELTNLGLSTPPLHGLCRTTTVPEV